MSLSSISTITPNALYFSCHSSVRSNWVQSTTHTPPAMSWSSTSLTLYSNPCVRQTHAKSCCGLQVSPPWHCKLSGLCKPTIFRTAVVFLCFCCTGNHCASASFIRSRSAEADIAGATSLSPADLFAWAVLSVAVVAAGDTNIYTSVSFCTTSFYPFRSLL